MIAFLVRCPFCRRPKRVDEPRAADGAFPVVWCIACGLRFYAWLNDDGTCRAAHVGITGAGTHATRATGVEQALAGKRLDDATLTAASANAADSLDLMSDPYASGEYRAHLTRVLAKRALAQAAATAAQR